MWAGLLPGLLVCSIFSLIAWNLLLVKQGISHRDWCVWQNVMSKGQEIVLVGRYRASFRGPCVDSLLDILEASVVSVSTTVYAPVGSKHTVKCMWITRYKLHKHLQSERLGELGL